ncbi:MAG: GNAT family N-acetyltransferase [Gemmataceae bacterium]|nr:GNAT family N-acetyltransferase [Gemmataceae bacterium]
MQVRRARPEDLDIVCEFNGLLAQESEGKALDMAKLRPGVSAALADAHKGIYFLAEEGTHILGQMGITYEWSDWRNGWFWWIQSVFVRAEARRRGVFRAIFEHIVQAAKADPAVIGVRLYVENDNHVAHATYQKMGFEWTSYRVMERYPL